MTNTERQKEYVKLRSKEIKKSFSLDAVIESTVNPGWCDAHQEINYLAQELSSLKDLVNKLRRELNKLKEKDEPFDDE